MLDLVHLNCLGCALEKTNNLSPQINMVDSIIINIIIVVININTIIFIIIIFLIVIIIGSTNLMSPMSSHVKKTIIGLGCKNAQAVLGCKNA